MHLVDQCKALRLKFRRVYLHQTSLRDQASFASKSGGVMEYCRDRRPISEIRNCGFGTHFDRKTTRNPDRINGDNSCGTQKPTPGSLVPAEKLARRTRSHGGFLGNWQARKTPKNILNRRSQRSRRVTVYALRPLLSRRGGSRRWPFPSEELSS